MRAAVKFAFVQHFMAHYAAYRLLQLQHALYPAPSLLITHH